MPKGFMNVHFHVDVPDTATARGVDSPRALNMPEAAQSPLFGPGQAPFANDENAARFYLHQELDLDQRPAARALTAPEEPGLVPNLELTSVAEQPLTNTRLVQFQQSQAAIPVFGSHAIVELSADRALLSLDADIAPVDTLKTISPVPTLTVPAALAQLATLSAVEQGALASLPLPTLMLYYRPEDDTWHLAYFFTEVPAAPLATQAADAVHPVHGHGPDLSLRELRPEYNYLIDAHDGALLLAYPAHALLDIPALCRGVDETGAQWEFFGRGFNTGAGSGFELFDPTRNLRTCDLQFGVIDPNLPPQPPIQNPQNDWADQHKAAVSAHVNAMRVYDFYKSVLQRNSVDNQGMELVSMINCLQVAGSPSHVLRNAFWWKGRMWYGQDQDEHGNFHSTARYLDIIGHELTHGVTETTSNLVYLNQAGALNESFSDIFGVIINNWYGQGADSDVATWNWEIGPNWNGPSQPLRDLSNPARLGDPAHMEHFLFTFGDSGGVHTNSNIHNKAAHNVLTALDEQGQRIFTPRIVAMLYYLTLTRLPPQATFAKTLQVLLDVTATVYAGDAEPRQHKLAALRTAYAAVGIILQEPA